MEERVSRLEVDDKGANEKEACRIQPHPIPNSHWSDVFLVCAHMSLEDAIGNGQITQ